MRLNERPVHKHPIIVVEQIVSKYGQDVRLTFSRYQVGPPGDQYTRPRTTFVADAAKVTREWLRDELQKLKADEELAFHSKVSLNDKIMHIPMIDFDRELPVSTLRELGTRVLRECLSDAMETNRSGSLTLYSFETGRSYHQYADTLILDSGWCAFLGNLLLLNPASAQPSVDCRWVGHALKRGYAALRWTRNTERYISLPRLVDKTAIPVYV